MDYNTGATKSSSVHNLAWSFHQSPSHLVWRRTYSHSSYLRKQIFLPYRTGLHISSTAFARTGFYPPSWRGKIRLSEIQPSYYTQHCLLVLKLEEFDRLYNLWERVVKYSTGCFPVFVRQRQTARWCWTFSILACYALQYHGRSLRGPVWLYTPR